ncbi:MAG: hypothetical protein GDA53_04265 [Rhodobacteraceae bacterium]|nr:hypothetical protein [Paracoccaceae bacterium]
MNECVSKTEDPRIVFTENRQKATFLNPNRREIRKVKVDGCAITSGRRCDYMLSDQRNWYIELKGKEIEYALKQICESILHLNQKFGNLQPVAVIVADHVPANAGFQKAWGRAKKDGALNLLNLKDIRLKSRKIKIKID